MTPPSFVAQAYEPQDDPDMMYTEVQRLVENEKYEPAARLCNKILDIQSHTIVTSAPISCNAGSHLAAIIVSPKPCS